MGTGVSIMLSPPDPRGIPQNQICHLFSRAFFQSWPSPRPISTAPLSASLRLHSRPIYLVVFEGPYLSPMGGLISEGASRLDAFSAYPVRTWLPSCATGVTTGAPSVRPPRSSRTRGSSPQTSCAHDR